MPAQINRERSSERAFVFPQARETYGPIQRIELQVHVLRQNCRILWMCAMANHLAARRWPLGGSLDIFPRDCYNRAAFKRFTSVPKPNLGKGGESNE